MGQAFERGDKQAGNEKDKKTEGDLQCDQGMHQAASGMRVFSAFERDDWLGCGGTHRGSRPNRKVTPRVSAKPKTRQSAGRNSRAGLSGGLILLTTNGAAHHANNAPSAKASMAIQPLSISASCTRRQRPAPMEIRRPSRALALPPGQSS